MATMLAEQLAQRAFDLGLIDARQLETVRGEIGSSEAPADVFRGLVLRKELLTNWQIERLIKGESTGFFYGRYKILYLTGTGTFARVYRAVHTETGKVYAVKVLRNRFRKDPAEVDAFLREGKMGISLRHPNIVPIYEVGKEREPYLVMDFVEGQNLRDFVKVRRKLDPATSLRLITDIVSGLAYAAQSGISHRDLKLSNALVTSRGQARLVDFGLYGVRGEGSDNGEMVNPQTIDYATLEKTTGVKREDPRSDIYFAGCMFYHMLIGTPPLEETRDRQARQSESRFRNVKPISVVDPSLPRPIISVVQKAMELNVARRYQTLQEMLFDLQLAAKRIANQDTEDSSGKGKKHAEDAEPAITHTVMLVESKVSIQNALRERFKKDGYRVLVISDPERALSRFEDDPEKPIADCVVFGTAELGVTSVEAFNRFGTHVATKQIPAVLIVDEDFPELAASAESGPNRIVLKMPFTVRELRTAMQTLLANRVTSSSGN